jgi:cell division protein FtsW (lipid II flippase)
MLGATLLFKSGIEEVASHDVKLNVTCRSVQTDLVITVSPFEHGLMELLVIVFAVAGVILGLLMILQSIYTLFKKPQ